MRRYFGWWVAILMTLVSAVHAGEGEQVKDDAAVPPIRTDDFYMDLYFPKEREVKLSKRERFILDKVKEFDNDEFLSNPMHHPDGSIQFIYGTSFPTVVCAVLQVTDIELEPGEIINSISLGDTARWRLAEAVSSSSAGEIRHVIVKPMEVGVTTSMIIATNRRTYRLRLKSTQNEFIPFITFAYPDQVVRLGQTIETKEEEARIAKTIPETGEYLGDLHFDYRISGRGRFRPTRVYNNEEKTIIEMPSNMKQKEAPVLLVVRREGRLFKKAETVLVNYRMQGNRYVVDSVFDKAYLVKGVGGNQERVVIERVKKRGE